MSDDKQPTSDEVKAKVVEEFGFDEETHSEQIEKLTNERLENQKNLSKAIEQKTKYRNIAVEGELIDKETFEPIEKKPKGKQPEKVEFKKLKSQEGLSREEAIFFAKGFNEDDLTAAKKIAALEDISLIKAIDDRIFKARIEERKEEEKSKKAQLPPAGGGSVETKTPVEEMNKDEHAEKVKTMIEKGLSGEL